LLFSACDATEQILGDGRPPAIEAATAFTQAWTERDYEAMAAFFDEQSSAQWSPDRLESVFDKTLKTGAITELTVSPDPTYEDEPEDVAAFSLSVGYDSSFLDEQVILSGPLEMTYSEDAESWQVAWTKDLLWPGVEGGKSFAVRTKFATRGTLFDRKGRKLAAGPAAERRYPFGSAAGTTIGHIEPVTRKNIPDGIPLVPGDLVGGSGLEEAFNERLMGTPDVKLQLIGHKEKVLATIGRQEGAAPKRVKTTLDIRVQQAAEAAYGSTTGGAVVLEPKTGDILAAVASSPFDPANYVGVAGIEPFNRALSGLYPAGSSMKVMTAAAALDLGEYKPISTLTGPAEYKGVRNFESGAFGTLTFASALQNSVNTAFAQMAEKIGPKRLKRYADMFGFNREPSMPLHAARSSFPFPEDEGDLMWSSIGQAQTLSSPLQMATMAATIANGGRRMEPRIDISSDPSGERIVSKKTARIMRGLMESVVQGGTGVNAQISGVRVAGKTGTAEVDVGGERRNHAWFICFAPAGDPKVAVAVVSEYGGVGGQVAAPLARSILTRVLPLL
jgi:peptidoglycan glycosyltransferase